jgi:hypothetical protein
MRRLGRLQVRLGRGAVRDAPARFEVQGQASYDGALRLARSSAGADLRGHRAEFIKPVETAQALSARERAGR